MIVPSSVHHDIPAATASDEQQVKIDKNSPVPLFSMVLNSFLCNGYTLKEIKGEIAVFVRNRKTTSTTAIPAIVMDSSLPTHRPPFPRTDGTEVEVRKTSDLGQEMKTDEDGNIVLPPCYSTSTDQLPTSKQSWGGKTLENVVASGATVPEAKKKPTSRKRTAGSKEEKPKENEKDAEAEKKQKKQRTKKALSEVKKALIKSGSDVDDQSEKPRGGKGRKQAHPQRLATVTEEIDEEEKNGIMWEEYRKKAMSGNNTQSWFEFKKERLEPLWDEWRNGINSGKLKIGWGQFIKERESGKTIEICETISDDFDAEVGNAAIAGLDAEWLEQLHAQQEKIAQGVLSSLHDSESSQATFEQDE